MSDAAKATVNSPEDPPKKTGGPFNTHAKIRVFASPRKYSGAPLVLGRSHASWFIVFARPFGVRGKRADLCLNLVTSDPRTVQDVCPDTKRPRFTIGGSMGREALEMLELLRNVDGHPPVTIVRKFDWAARRDGVIAEVRVDIPEAELAYVCARCGKWEVTGGPRFLRCSSCKARYYCSQTCQKEDWKPALHKGDCALLRVGKAFEVERRRRLHDNEWWLNNSLLAQSSPAPSLFDNPYMNALNSRDWDFVGYGERNAPRSAVPPRSFGFPAGVDPLCNDTPEASLLTAEELARRMGMQDLDFEFDSESDSDGHSDDID